MRRNLPASAAQGVEALLTAGYSGLPGSSRPARAARRSRASALRPSCRPGCRGTTGLEIVRLQARGLVRARSRARRPAAARLRPAAGPTSRPAMPFSSADRPGAGRGLARRPPAPARARPAPSATGPAAASPRHRCRRPPCRACEPSTMPRMIALCSSAASGRRCHVLGAGPGRGRRRAGSAPARPRVDAELAAPRPGWPRRPAGARAHRPGSPRAAGASARGRA